MRRRIGVLLCGCGAYDGSDPSETVLLILEIQKSGHEAILLALQRGTLRVVDHLTGLEASGEIRNQYSEAARIKTGIVYPLDEISPKLLDALVIPGGQGVVKNLMTGTLEGASTQVIPEIEAFIIQVHEHGAPIGAISLAEFILTGIFGPFPEEKGGLDVGPEEIISNPSRKLFLTPGNLTAADLPQLHRGIQALLSELLARID